MEKLKHGAGGKVLKENIFYEEFFFVSVQRRISRKKAKCFFLGAENE